MAALASSSPNSELARCAHKSYVIQQEMFCGTFRIMSMVILPMAKSLFVQNIMWVIAGVTEHIWQHSTCNWQSRESIVRATAARPINNLLQC
jgi:hypothetical protein